MCSLYTTRVRASEYRVVNLGVAVRLLTAPRKLKTLYSKKYGIAHARFTHKSTTIIHASTKNDHALRYHSMHDNKYLAYFQGHTAR